MNLRAALEGLLRPGTQFKPLVVAIRTGLGLPVGPTVKQVRDAETRRALARLILPSLT